jgi:hypothetical protein
MSAELRAAVLVTLRAATALSETPVWDTAERGTKYPYIELGEETLSDDGYDYGLDRVDGMVINLGIHVYSKQNVSPQCRTLTKAVRAALHENEEIAIAGHRLISALHTATQYPPDPDANVEHGVVMFEFLIETV